MKRFAVEQYHAAKQLAVMTSVIQYPANFVRTFILGLVLHMSGFGSS